MKTSNILSIFSLCIVFLFLTCEPEIEQPVEVLVPEGILEELENTRPRELFVYEILAGNPQQWLNRFSENLNLGGQPGNTEDLLFLKQGEQYLEVRKVSNSVFQGDLGRLWTETPSPDSTRFNVISNERAETLSRDWALRFGFTEAEARELDIAVHNEEFELTLPSNEDQPIPVVVGKNIEIRRKVDGLKVYGPGSKIKLFLNAKGDVNGFLVVWRQFFPQSRQFGHTFSNEEPKRSLESIISAKRAFRVLRQDPLKGIPITFVTQIDIETIDVGYYAHAAANTQKFLQPVYVFRGSTQSILPDGREVTAPYEQYVPALRQAYESIWPAGVAFEPMAREADLPPVEQDEDERGE